MSNFVSFPYTIKRHHAARRLKLRVTGEGKVLVTIPQRSSLVKAEQFVREYSPWITEQLEKYASATMRTSFVPLGATYHTYRLRAHRLVRDKIAEWNKQYRVPFKRVSIRAQSTRWGSCSRSGTLSFNYKIYFLPEPLLDYVIVHELCHVREMNHSRKFWAQVAETIPDHVARRRALGRYTM
jgi:predicted metal-dependent hydrolase